MSIQNEFKSKAAHGSGCREVWNWWKVPLVCLGLELVESISLGCSVLGGSSSLAVPVPLEWVGTGGSQWLWLSDLISGSHNWPKCVPGKALLFLGYLQVCDCYHGDFSPTEVRGSLCCLLHPAWAGDLCLETSPDLVRDVLQLEPAWGFTCIQPLLSSPATITVVKGDLCCSVGL